MDVMLNLISRNRLSKLGYYAMSLVALACLAWTLASTFWLLMSVVQADNQPVTNKPLTFKPFSKPTAVGHNIRTVSELYLFGKPEKFIEQSDASKLANISAPETKLNLKLMGLRRGSGAIQSSAIIEGPDRKQNIYYIGDKLPSGDAVVEEIFVQHMVISRHGKYETLTLFTILKSRSDKPNKKEQVTTEKVTDLTNNRFITTKLNKYKDIAFKEPTALVGIVHVEPVLEGDKFIGYKLSPGIDSALFVKAGLRRGDVLTSINGVRLDSPNKALSLMASLTFTNDLELTIDRAGESKLFRYSF